MLKKKKKIDYFTNQPEQNLETCWTAKKKKKKEAEELEEKVKEPWSGAWNSLTWPPHRVEGQLWECSPHSNGEWKPAGHCQPGKKMKAPYHSHS